MRIHRPAPREEAQSQAGDQSGQREDPLSTTFAVLGAGQDLSVVDGGSRMIGSDGVSAFGVGGQQGLVGVDVDAAGQTFRRLGNEIERFAREKVGAFVAGGPQTGSPSSP